MKIHPIAVDGLKSFNKWLTLIDGSWFPFGLTGSVS